jgi:predicted RNA-binding protein with PUA-like domain
MQYFLAKTEPTEYSIDDLQKEQESIWDGVRNPTACMHIKSMKVGDQVFIYHSNGKSPAVVGLAEVTKVAYQDPTNKRSWIPTFKFLKKFDTPITLSEIKDSHKFDNWSLVRIGRLSTMPTPIEFVNWLKTKKIY